jgi:GTP cyclohydrolase I
MNEQPLPDIAAQATHHDLPLDWVGMAGIALPIRLADAAVTASVDIGVSLDDAGARGIHMSRLYLAAQRLVHQSLNVPAVLQVLDDCLSSHQALSDSATLTLRGEVPLKRPALVSPLNGWTCSSGRSRREYRITGRGRLLLHLPLLGSAGTAADPATLRLGLSRSAG